MAGLRGVVARVRGLWRRDGIAAEIREEIDFHIAARADDYARSGLSADEARRKARARVGDVAIHVDRGYEVRGAGVMDTIFQDIRHGLRLFRRQPVFAGIAVLTLALGIGAATAIFSIVEAALLRPLPYPQAEQIVDVTVAMPQRSGGFVNLGASLDDAAAWRRSTEVFSHLAASRGAGGSVLDGPEPIRLDSYLVTSEFMPLYGVVPALGRLFASADEDPSAPAVAMLSHAVWQSRFGAQTSVIGTTIRYGGEPVVIVGVTPPWFRAETDLWRPLIAAREPTFKARRGSGGGTTARLRPGVTIDDAQRVLTAALPVLPASSPAPAAAPRVVLTQEVELRLARYRPMIATLAGSVGLILLIACVNVAGLLLARGATRQGEVAVRTSLGASRRRLIRQFLTESLVLSTIGGTLGILLAWLTLQTLLANIPLTLPADAPAGINGFVLIASLALTFVTGTLFGLAPALRLSRDSLGSALARSGRQHGAALTRRGGQSLITVEVALAVVMLAGAGLMIRSFSRLVSHDLGFDPQRFVALDVIPAEPVPAVYAEYYQALVRQLRALPSVAAAGAIDVAPLVNGGSYTSATAEGRSVGITMRQIIPGYFETIGLAAASGRLPVDADLTSAEKTIVLSTSAATQLFPGLPPIGRQVLLSNVPRTVVGVVPDVRHGPPGAQRTEPNVYFTYEPDPTRIARGRGLTVLVATRPGATLPAADLRRVAASIGPRVIVDRVRSGAELFSEGVSLPRRRTILLSILGGFGLLLSIVGVVGMTSYAVARRTREIGVRMAFGARADQVVRAMLLDSVWPIAIGVGIGVAGAWLSTGVIKSFLYETTPTDPGTLAAVALALALAGVLAAWIPARRAARVDPVSALRAD